MTSPCDPSHLDQGEKLIYIGTREKQPTKQKLLICTSYMKSSHRKHYKQHIILFSSGQCGFGNYPIAAGTAHVRTALLCQNVSIRAAQKALTATKSWLSWISHLLSLYYLLCLSGWAGGKLANHKSVDIEGYQESFLELSPPGRINSAIFAWKPCPGWRHVMSQ